MSFTYPEGIRWLATGGSTALNYSKETELFQALTNNFPTHSNREFIAP
jgi:hypothetical protein